MIGKKWKCIDHENLAELCCAESEGFCNYDEDVPDDTKKCVAEDCPALDGLPSLAMVAIHSV